MSSVKTVCVVALGFDAARKALTLLRRYDSAAKSTGAAPHTQPKQARALAPEAYGCKMAEQNTPKLVQDAAEPAPVAADAGLGADRARTALVAEAAG